MDGIRAGRHGSDGSDPRIRFVRLPLHVTPDPAGLGGGGGTRLAKRRRRQPGRESIGRARGTYEPENLVGAGLAPPVARRTRGRAAQPLRTDRGPPLQGRAETSDGGGIITAVFAPRLARCDAAKTTRPAPRLARCHEAFKTLGAYRFRLRPSLDSGCQCAAGWSCEPPPQRAPTCGPDSQLL